MSRNIGLGWLFLLIAVIGAGCRTSGAQGPLPEDPLLSSRVPIVTRTPSIAAAESEEVNPEPPAVPAAIVARRQRNEN